MFRVTIEYPHDPELGQRPNDSDVFDEQADAEAWAAQAREHGLTAHCYEMGESECYAHNVSVHAPHGY